ncbi:MAG TPA: hypothetical protein VH950_15700 [Gaiellaceae bacterium]|jgi:hypothetical protein
MFDAFPFDEWSDDIAEFWTFGGAGSTGTWILTILGFSVMLIAFVWFVIMENGKLERQAETLKASGALDRPANYT